MAKPPTSIELRLALSAADEVLVSAHAQGSDDRRTKERPLGPGWNTARVRGFGDAVRWSAERGAGLDAELRDDAHALHRAILAEEVGELCAKLGEAGGPLLVRLVIDTPALQGVPWEALCRPGEALGFWANSPDLLPVRGVTSTERREFAGVTGAVRVLPISPTGDRLDILKLALGDRIDAGEVEWLEPVAGAAATSAGLRERLRKGPVPHVLHFLGHGGQRDGKPEIRLADDDGKERWLSVEILAQQLKEGFGGTLRLVVLEACEGARPSDFCSAAEVLAKVAGAAVAHLWPVEKRVARLCSAEFYRALAGAGQGGDVARALNDARRAILSDLDGTAEAFSPVLYLRGSESALFDFKGRTVRRPPPLSAPRPEEHAARPPQEAPSRDAVAEVAELLARSPALARALAAQGYEGPHAELARALVTAPPPKVAEDLGLVVDGNPGLRAAARDLLCLVLPVARDWAEVVERVDAARASRRPLVLRLRTETIAEIVVASEEQRRAEFVPGAVRLHGADYIPMPASAYAPLPDASLADAILKNLVEARPGRDPERWLRLSLDLRDPAEYRAAARQMIKSTERRKTGPYLLVIDGKFDDSTADRDAWWGSALELLQDEERGLRGLRLIRLTGGGAEDVGREYAVLSHIQNVFGSGS